MSNPAHDNRETSPDYTVGYGRPPVERRFKKGVSGNPRGRPKKRERAWSQHQLDADILLEANAEVAIQGAKGKTERVPMQQLIVRRILTEAAKGNLSAAKIALDFIIQAAAGRAQLHPRLYNGVQEAERKTVMGPPPPGGGEIYDFLDYLKKKTRLV